MSGGFALQIYTLGTSLSFMRVVQKAAIYSSLSTILKVLSSPLRFVFELAGGGPAKRQRIYTDNKVIARNLAAGGQESWYLAGILTA